MKTENQKNKWKEKQPASCYIIIPTPYSLQLTKSSFALFPAPLQHNWYLGWNESHWPSSHHERVHLINQIYKNLSIRTTLITQNLSLSINLRPKKIIIMLKKEKGKEKYIYTFKNPMYAAHNINPKYIFGSLP